MKKAGTDTAKKETAVRKSHGSPGSVSFRLTPQRMMILRLLKADRSHPKAEDIYQKVRAEYPNVSLKTVYNTLDILTKKQMIQELVIEPRIKRYCPDPAPHHHILCMSCRKVVDVFQNIPVRLARKRTGGFRILSNQITFRGICPDCRTDDEERKNRKRGLS